MSQQIVGTGVVGGALPSPEGMAARLASLADYGPLQVTTYILDIPGIEYRQPFPNQADQRPHAIIGSSAISLLRNEAAMSVAIQAEGQSEPFILAPDQLETVIIEHPHGHYMPLHGSKMMAIGARSHDNIPVLRWADHAIEFGHYDRIETGVHPEYPGISVVRAYQADDENIMNDKPSKFPTLEEAKEKDSEPRTFLISKVDSATFVATSRLGYDRTTPVIVRRPSHPGDEPLVHVEMIDMKKGTTDEELLENHLRHYRDVSKQYFDTPKPMTPFQADAIFLYMVCD